MQKILLFCGSLLVTIVAHSQNTFPPSGNVGIGTAAQSALHVAGVAVSKDVSSQYSGPFIVQGNSGGRTTTSNGAQIEFVIPANTDGTNFWGQGRILTIPGNGSTSNATGKMIMGTRRSFNKLGTGTQWYYGDDITIDGTGNVGIGTTTPQSQLHLNGSQLVTQGYFALTTTGNSTATGGAAGFSLVTTAPNSFNNGYSDLQSFYAGVGYTAPMVLQRQGGNVWVGDPTALSSFSDNYKLNVNGNIRANKLVVNTTGADFVFEPTYKLLPLNQLEKYITANRHLPGIETAGIMQKDGVDLGENQTKLLQKIEELTLYAIVQEKQLHQSDAKITELNKMLEQQASQLQQQQFLLTQLQQQLNILTESKK